MKDTQTVNLSTLHTAVTAIACAVDAARPESRFSHVMLTKNAVGAFDGVLRAYEPCAGLTPPAVRWVPGALLVPALTAAMSAAGSAKHPATLSYTDQHVTLSCGGFRARLPVLQAPDGAGPLGDETGEWSAPACKPWAAAIAADVHRALSLLAPVPARGAGSLAAALPWAQGVHIAASGALYAVQNVCAARYTMPNPIKGWPPIGLTLPIVTVAEILRRETPPTALHALVGDDGPPTACAVYYGAAGAPLSRSVLISALVPGPWPDSVEALFNPDPKPKAKDYRSIDEAMLAAVETLTPFAPPGAPPVIRFKGAAGVAVHGALGEELAAQTLPKGAPCAGAFRADVLTYALQKARRACWERYPRIYWDEGLMGPLQGVFIGTNA